jgi:hypothetical protein
MTDERERCPRQSPHMDAATEERRALSSMNVDGDRAAICLRTPNVLYLISISGSGMHATECIDFSIPIPWESSGLYSVLDQLLCWDSAVRGRGRR